MRDASIHTGGVGLTTMYGLKISMTLLPLIVPKAADGPAVTSIVVAAGEVGSGTAGAAGGKHFSKLTPRGIPGHPEHHVRP